MRASRTRTHMFAVGAVALCLIVGYVLLRGGLGETQGPLKPAPNSTIHGAKVSNGDELTWGGIYIHNDTDTPVTLKDVTLVPEDGKSDIGITVLRVEATTPSPGATGIGIDTGDAYAVIPAQDRKPARGFTVPPRGFVNILVKVRATKPGTWRFDSADVRYLSTGKSHVVTMPQALGLCVDTAGECNLPQE